MAEDDVETLTSLNYYMSESYFRRVQMESLNATRKFGSDPVLVLFKGLSMLMEGRIQESMRELELIRDKPDVLLASLISLVIAHKKSRNVDREAVLELDAKVKEERRNAGEKDLFFASLSLWHLGKSDKAREYSEKLLKNHSSSIRGSILRGWIDLTSDRDSYVKKCVRFFDEGLDQNNREPWGLIGKARYYVRRNNFTAALELINQAIVFYPNFTPAHVERMRLHLALQDWDQSLEAAIRLLSLDARHPEALITQIMHLMAIEGKASEAVNRLGELIQVIDRFEPQNTKLYMKSGKLFARMCGRNIQVLNQTKTLVERAVSLDPTNAEYTCELGYQLFLQGKIRDAMKCYRNAMELDETSVGALTGVIRCQLLAEDFGGGSMQQQRETLEEVNQQLEFLREVQQAIGQDPELLYLNGVHARRSNTTQEQCLQFLSDAVNTHFKSLRGTPLSAEYFTLLNPDFILDIAREMLSMGPTQAVASGQPIPAVLTHCISSLDPVTKISPGLLDALYLSAKAKFLAGDTDSAVATLQHCLDQDSTYSDAHLLMAQIHQQRGNHSLATQYLEAALSFNFEIRDHPLYHLIKAKTLLKSNEVAEAIQTLKMALVIPGVRKPPSASQKQAKKGLAISSTDRLAIFLELVKAHTIKEEHHEAAKVMQDAINAFQGTPEEIRVTIANADLSLSRGDVEQALTMLRNIKPEQSYYVQAKEKMAYIYLHYRKDKNLYTSCYRDLVNKHPTAHSNLLLGDAYMSIQEPEKAIAVYEQVMKKNPRDATLASKIGQALVKTHDYRKAIAYYETALKNGQQQHLRFELAELLLKMKLYDKMEAVLTQISDDDRMKGETELERAMFDTQRILLLSSLYKERNEHEKVSQALAQAREKQARVLKRVQIEQPDAAAAQKHLASDICCRMAAHENERNKDTLQAIKYYKEALIYCENDSKTMIQLAKLYLQTGELEMCQQYCMQILKQTDTSGHDEASMMMADIMFRKQNYEDAIYHYEKLLQAKPDYYRALARLIGLLRRSGKLDAAPQFLGLETDGAKNDPGSGGKLNVKSGTSNDPGYHYCKGLYEWYSGKTKDALRSFNIARRDTDWGELAVENMIRICLNPDQDTLGGEVLENLDDTNSNEKATAAEAGVSTAERLLREMLKTQALSPSTALKRRILEKYVLLAPKQKQFAEKALAGFMEILQTEKDNVPCLLGMAIAYQTLKQTPRARNQLKRISKMQWTLEDADDFEQAWLLLADVYISAGKYDMATELLKKCLEHNKSCCKAFEYLGFIYEKEQSYQDASQNYEKAWQYGNEANPVIGYKLSFNYLKAKRFIDAINICHKVLKKNPQYPKIRKEILDKARSSLRM